MSNYIWSRIIAFSKTRGIPWEDHLDWMAIVDALKDMEYDECKVNESFAYKIKESAKAVEPLATSQDDLARCAIKLFKELFYIVKDEL